MSLLRKPGRPLVAIALLGGLIFAAVWNSELAPRRHDGSLRAPRLTGAFEVPLGLPGAPEGVSAFFLSAPSSPSKPAPEEQDEDKDEEEEAPAPAPSASARPSPPSPSPSSSPPGALDELPLPFPLPGEAP